jgi:glycosyltransferase involved in cell wall biosynthesis
VIIAVNARLLIHGRLDGISRFACETLRRITVNRPNDHFVFLFDRPIHEEFLFSDNITPVKLFPPARRPLLWDIWLNWSVNGVLKDLKPDLFFSPDGYIPLRGNTPCLTTMNFEHYPQDLPPSYSKWLRKRYPEFARKAKRIVTVSEYSREDISKTYAVSPDKIDIVHNGAMPGFCPLNETEIVEVQKKYAKGCPYFLFIGALHPRKNLERLIRAFGLFRKNNQTNTKLVIAGGNYWKYDSLNEALATLPDKDEVIFTGRLPEEELYRLTAGALALSYVPYFEGFGIPIVEAMACNVPVITSNVTSMPEVAGDAALYVDPFSEESIANGLQQMNNDLVLRKKLIANATIQREKFSWDKSAETLWQIMEKTIAEAKNKT